MSHGMSHGMKHATVMRDGYRVPLIGIPSEATEDGCDFCGAMMELPDIYTDGQYFLCKKCAGAQKPTAGDV